MESFNQIENKKFIFFSTADANNRIGTIYTRQKLLAEGLLMVNRDAILRPSLVIDNKSDKRIIKLFNSLVLIPRNNSRLAPMKVDELNSFVINSSVSSGFKGKILIAGKKRSHLKSFLRMN